MSWEEDIEGAISLGREHHYVWLHSGGPFADGSSPLVGIIEWHPRPDGSGRCAGTVRWSGDGAKHQLVSLDPLTISPSLLCTRCGNHGFIQDGQWRGA